MPDIKHNSEIKKLEHDALIDLFEIDISPIYVNSVAKKINVLYAMHNYPVRPEDSNALNAEDKNAGVLVYQGKKFYPFPYTSEGFDRTTDGALPRPILRISNIDPAIQALLSITNGLVGAHVYRYRVFRKYLDNMPTSNESSSSFPRDMFILSKKRMENKFFIEFELVTPLEHGNISVPRRIMLTHTCIFQYRGEGCGYNDVRLFDIDNNPLGEIGLTLSAAEDWVAGKNYVVSDAIQNKIGNIRGYYVCIKDHVSTYINKYSSEFWQGDICGKILPSCALRHGKDSALPFGGFPNANIG
jgi:lambda family phage minor tail protein L